MTDNSRVMSRSLYPISLSFLLRSLACSLVRSLVISRSLPVGSRSSAWAIKRHVRSAYAGMLTAPVMGLIGKISSKRAKQFVFFFFFLLKKRPNVKQWLGQNPNYNATYAVLFIRVQSEFTWPESIFLEFFKSNNNDNTNKKTRNVQARQIYDTE